jgi:osmotically-inducible protein OsmY
MKILILWLAISVLLSGVAHSVQNDISCKNIVKQVLKQADVKGVKVSGTRDKNTITLGGTLQSESAKEKAGKIAKSAANTCMIANEISVQPVGLESEAKSIASNLDEVIERSYKASLISNGLDKQHINARVKNSVLTLTGSVQTADQRQQAQRLGIENHNVLQVVNQIEIRQ